MFTSMQANPALASPSIRFRLQLEAAILTAAKELLSFTRAASAVIPVPGADPLVVVAVGQPESIVDDKMLTGYLR